MTTWDFGIAATFESRIADLCKTGIVTPATLATIPMKSQETARAAAIAPPIKGLAEGNRRKPL